MKSIKFNNKRSADFNSPGSRLKYFAPRIQTIILDNEISLALQSTPPDGPGEEAYLLHNLKNNNSSAGNLIV
jgi:hypothetical protein